MSGIQIQHDYETSFTKPLKRAIFRDARLSYGARGLFAMMWDFPTNWRFIKSHLVKLSPGGKVQLQGYINELKNIGALQILPNKMSINSSLSNQEAGIGKHSKLDGWIWRLNHPDKWALEAALSNHQIEIKGTSKSTFPKDRFPDVQGSSFSENMSFRKPSTKGLQLKGSANIRPLPQDNDVEKVTSGSTDYIFPKQLTSQERDFAKPQLDLIDSALAQAALDELAARLNANKVTGAPLSYLRSLINRAKEGLFIPEVGVRVAAAREQAKLAQLKKMDEVIKPSDPKEIPKHLAAMHQALSRKSISNSNKED